MQLVCPCCHARFPIEAALNDAEARAAIEEVVRHFGDEVARLSVRYLGTFRPAKRVLAWSRFARLLRVLAETMASDHLERNGRPWRVTREQWAEALGVVVGRHQAGQLTLPMKDHGYLFEVARRLADRAEAEAERAAEAELRNRPRSGGGPAPVGEIAERLVDSPARQEAMRKAREVMGGRFRGGQSN